VRNATSPALPQATLIGITLIQGHLGPHPREPCEETATSWELAMVLGLASNRTVIEGDSWRHRSDSQMKSLLGTVVTEHP
jgi:hypothetical protein